MVLSGSEASHAHVLTVALIGPGRTRPPARRADPTRYRGSLYHRAEARAIASPNAAAHVPRSYSNIGVLFSGNTLFTALNQFASGTAPVGGRGTASGQSGDLGTSKPPDSGVTDHDGLTVRGRTCLPTREECFRERPLWPGIPLLMAGRFSPGICATHARTEYRKLAFL